MEFKHLLGLTKYKKQEDVFDSYTQKRFVKLAEDADINDELVYAAAIGTDLCPILFKIGRHFANRVAQRLHCSYADIVGEKVVETIENHPELGDTMLEAVDAAYEKDARYAMVALFIEKYDVFAYLHVDGETIYAATVVTGQKVYHTNPDAEVVCWAKKDGSLVYGINNCPYIDTATNQKYDNMERYSC